MHLEYISVHLSLYNICVVKFAVPKLTKVLQAYHLILFNSLSNQLIHFVG